MAKIGHPRLAVGSRRRPLPLRRNLVARQRTLIFWSFLTLYGSDSKHEPLRRDYGAAAALTALIGALQLLCVLNRREFDGPISPFKKIQDTLIKSPLTWGTVPASYKTLIKVSCHLQHSFL
eukprot:COSAG01_NODE_47606_length_388_cov_4.470588_1_plen_120_part_01